jgi:hypothetical protein
MTNRMQEIEAELERLSEAGRDYSELKPLLKEYRILELKDEIASATEALAKLERGESK